MKISGPNRYLTSAASGTMLYNSFRIAPRASSLGMLVKGGSDIIAGEMSSLESYAGAALSTTLMAKYLTNPTRLENLLGVTIGAGSVQAIEMIGGIQKFSSDKIKKEVLIAAIIAIIAGKLGNIKKLKEILGEDEWAAILDGLRRRMESCDNNG